MLRPSRFIVIALIGAFLFDPALSVAQSWARLGGILSRAAGVGGKTVASSVRGKAMAALVGRVERAAASGTRDGAASALNDLATMMRLERSPDALADAGALEELARSIRARSTGSRPVTGTPVPVRPLFQTFDQFLVDGFPERLALPKQQEVVLSTFREAVPSTAKRPRLVSPSVKRFGEKFMDGAWDGDDVLQTVKTLDPARVAKWRNTPQEKRLFVVGAREDTEHLAPSFKALEDQGYEVFFYRLCESRPGMLCDSETVGAFFATAGNVLVSRSSAAAMSEFVKMELAVIDALLTGSDLWFMITPLGLQQMEIGAFATAGLLGMAYGVTPIEFQDKEPSHA
jgi:hypothetical protein